MRLAVLASLLLMPGCLSDGGADFPGAGDSGRTEPWQVADRGFATSNAGGTFHAPFALGQDVSSLQIRIDFTTSAHTGLRFTAPEPCVGLDTGSGIYPNSSTWTGDCGPLPAGDHVLTWTLEGGYVSGTLTATAVP